MPYYFRQSLKKKKNLFITKNATARPARRAVISSLVFTSDEVGVWVGSHNRIAIDHKQRSHKRDRKEMKPLWIVPRSHDSALIFDKPWALLKAPTRTLTL